MAYQTDLRNSTIAVIAVEPAANIPLKKTYKQGELVNTKQN